MKHSHEWKYYQGCLGYESSRCAGCGVDWNDDIDARHEDALTENNQ